jgi:hypothetical protein
VHCRPARVVTPRRSARPGWAGRPAQAIPSSGYAGALSAPTLVAEPRRSKRLGPLISPGLVLIVGSVVSLVARWGPDWPAQEFRGWLAARYGLIAWTNNWYGGSALPGYSALYPVLASVLAVGAIGVAAAVAASFGAVDLARSLGARPGIGYQLAVAAVLVQLLLIGQLPFLLGAAFGVWSVRLLRSVSGWGTAAAAILAAGCALSSPLAGAFLLLLIPAVAVTSDVRRAASLLGALVGLAVPLVIGGEAGRFATQWESLVAIIAFVSTILLFTRREDRALRVFGACYLVVTVLIFVIPNPVGSNITRLGKLVALPLACWAVSSRRVRNRVVAVLVVLLATTWSSVPFVTAIARGAGDSSQNASFSAGLVKFLHSQDPTRGRLEIPFTREHWESTYVARAFPLARGWERQIDLHYNGVLYRTLSPRSYRGWLTDNAVALVALPKAPIDYGGRPEAALLRSAPSYLAPVWSDQHWTVWRVRNPAQIVSGAATIAAVTQTSFAVRFARAGSAVARFRSSKLWHVTGGRACIETNADGWLVIHAPQAGRVTVHASLNAQLLHSASGCG